MLRLDAVPIELMRLNNLLVLEDFFSSDFSVLGVPFDDASLSGRESSASLFLRECAERRLLVEFLLSVGGAMSRLESGLVDGERDLTLGDRESLQGFFVDGVAIVWAGSGVAFWCSTTRGL